jgi:hypothetical protein
MSRSKYAIVSIEDDRITIRDVGEGCMTVTNDVENVVARLRRDGLLPLGRRLFYYDSADQLDEIVLDAAGFVGFQPGLFR